MKTALTIHLGKQFVFAAVEVDEQIDLLALAESKAGITIQELLDSQIHSKKVRKPPSAEPDQFQKFGSTGDLEIQENPVFDDLSLAHLLSIILARCLRVADVYPDEVLLVITEEGPSEDTCLEAASRARIKNIKVLEENRSLAALASYGPKGVNPEFAAVIGALYWNRHGDSPTGSLPIVTREDLGATEKVVKKPVAPPSQPSVISLDDRSVFDLKINADGKKRFNLSWMFAVLVVCAGLASAYFFIFYDSEEVAQKTLETAVAPVSSVPVSSVPVSSVPVSSVPVSSVPVSSVPVSSVPVSDSTEGEKTVTPEVPRLGVVTLAERGLLLMAGTENQILLSFESPQEAVMSSLISILGEPIEESSATGDDICINPKSFKFDDLEVFFSSYDQGSIFSQWFVSGIGAKDTGLWTLNRIGVGSSISELKELSDSQILIEEIFPGTNDPAGKFRIDPFGLGMFIHGVASNTNDQGKILQMWAGEECQRLFAG